MSKTIGTDLNSIENLAKKIAAGLRGGEIFALMGTLGSGKTTFVRHLGKELKLKHKITSPTFSIMNRFEVRIPSSKKEVYLYHLDLYRTKDFKEVTALGLKEIWGEPNTITFIEWADKIKRHLPKKTVTIKFK